MCVYIYVYINIKCCCALYCVILRGAVDFVFCCLFGARIKERKTESCVCVCADVVCVLRCAQSAVASGRWVCGGVAEAAILGIFGFWQADTVCGRSGCTCGCVCVCPRLLRLLLGIGSISLLGLGRGRTRPHAHARRDRDGGRGRGARHDYTREQPSALSAKSNRA